VVEVVEALPIVMNAVNQLSREESSSEYGWRPQMCATELMLNVA